MRKTLRPRDRRIEGEALRGYFLVWLDGLMDPVVRVTGGLARGSGRGEVIAFLGIPYAAPAVGADRYRAPQPVVPWGGVRDATAHGPTASQSAYPSPLDTVLPCSVAPGDDYLNVSVWAPAEGESLPVMVWIHGGAFVRGAYSIPTYDGSAFARDGVLLVGINYRLGVQGFGVLDGAVTNLGLRDQIAALEWVRDSVAAFGGTPEAVTVFGESAGGMSGRGEPGAQRLRGEPLGLGVSGEPPQKAEADRGVHRGERSYRGREDELQVGAQLVRGADPVLDQLTAGTHGGAHRGGRWGVADQGSQPGPVGAYDVGQDVGVEPVGLVAGRAGARADVLQLAWCDDQDGQRGLEQPVAHRSVGSFDTDLVDTSFEQAAHQGLEAGRVVEDEGPFDHSAFGIEEADGVIDAGSDTTRDWCLCGVRGETDSCFLAVRAVREHPVVPGPRNRSLTDRAEVNSCAPATV